MWRTSPTLHRSGRHDAKALLRAQLDLATSAVDNAAKVAEAYWGMWGPWCAPMMVGTVEAAAEVQRRYLQTLRGTLGEGS